MKYQVERKGRLGIMILYIFNSSAKFKALWYYKRQCRECGCFYSICGYTLLL